jgi:hypothetical protein
LIIIVSLLRRVFAALGLLRRPSGRLKWSGGVPPLSAKRAVVRPAQSTPALVPIRSEKRHPINDFSVSFHASVRKNGRNKRISNSFYLINSER